MTLLKYRMFNLVMTDVVASGNENVSEASIVLSWTIKSRVKKIYLHLVKTNLNKIHVKYSYIHRSRKLLMLHSTMKVEAVYLFSKLIRNDGEAKTIHQSERASR